MSIEINKEEEKWIAALRRLCKKAPKSLWLYSNGTMHVMKYPDDGSSEMTPSGGVNPDNIAAIILDIHSDGGDW